MISCYKKLQNNSLLVKHTSFVYLIGMYKPDNMNLIGIYKPVNMNQKMIYIF